MLQSVATVGGQQFWDDIADCASAWEHGRSQQTGVCVASLWTSQASGTNINTTAADLTD